MTSFDHPPTVPLTVPPTAAPVREQSIPSYRDLPTSPPVYHQDEVLKAPRKTRKPKREMPRDERLALAVGVPLVVLVIAKVVADLGDIGTNVVDYLLAAVLAAVVGLAVVLVGGALLPVLRTRWAGLLDERPHRDPYPTDPRLL